MERKDLSKLYRDLVSIRQDVFTLRKNYRVDLGDIQAGYETVIDDLLEIMGLTEDQIDLFWEATEVFEIQ